MRTDIGLNATFCAPMALPGRLALVAQSGAVCTAMLDFAGPMQMGFSTVTSLGGGIDVGFGELLEALVHDPVTDGILLYVESVGEARPFLSALRAAARTKPVVVLKAGRSLERAADVDALGEPGIAPDAVFDAALKRAGTVRVHGYTQLFAAARILAMGRIPRGDRLAIVSNGRGPAVLAADCADDAGVALARFAPDTVAALDALLPPEIPRANPVDVRGDAQPAKLAAVVATALTDPNTDAIVVLHVPRPIVGAIEAAHAVAAVARDSVKPVLGAWLGAVNRPDVHYALEAGGIANFFTPENAVDAFSFLASYRRNQEWLLEVPSSQPDPEPPDFAAAERLRERAAAEGAHAWSPAHTRELLAAFGIATPPCAVVTSVADAQAAARRMRYPVTLAFAGTDHDGTQPALTDGRMLARAWRDLHAAAEAQTRRAGERGRRAARGDAGRGTHLRDQARRRPGVRAGDRRRLERARRRRPAHARADAGAAQSPPRARPARRSRHRGTGRRAGRAGAARVGDRLRAAVGARAVVRSRRRRQGRRGGPVPARGRRPEAQAGAGLPAHGDPSLPVRARVDDRAARRHATRRCVRSGPRTPSSSAGSSRGCRSRRAITGSSTGCTSCRRRCSRASRRSTTTASSRCSRLRPTRTPPARA